MYRKKIFNLYQVLYLDNQIFLGQSETMAFIKTPSAIKRRSSVLDEKCIVLDDVDDHHQHRNDLTDVNENYQEEDEEDLNYAADLRMAKRMSMHEKTLDNTTGARTARRVKDEETLRKESVLKRKRYLGERIDRICEFAQVLMHCLLYKINYYDKKKHFEKYIKYNIIVYVNKKF